MAMGNCRSCLKKLFCCSHDGTMAGAHQGPQNPPPGPPQSPSSVPARLPPTNPVGLDQPLEELKKKLHLQTTQFSSPGHALLRAVVIYGCGGIGKTTLANAVITTLAEDLKKYYIYSKVEIHEEPLQNDFKRMREWILRDRGRRQFIFIDNVVRSNDLQEILPEDIRRFPYGSRILVTTRNFSLTDLFDDRGIPRESYAVNPLAKEDALKILCKNPTHLHQISTHEEKIRFARGIPIVLDIVGAYMLKHQYKEEKCLEIFQILEDGKDVREENLIESLFQFVFKDLEGSTQEAFLDICSFFNGWPSRWVEYIVGVHEVTLLAEAALIKSLPFLYSGTDPEDWGKKKHLAFPKEFEKEGIYLVGEDKLIVQNVTQAKGRSMGESTRIKDRESWSKAVTSQDQTIKGVKLDSTEAIQIEESELSRISHSLRVLILGGGISIIGRSNQTFKELRCLILNGQISCLPMNLEWHPCLSFYVGSFIKDVLIKLPSKLKYLEAKQGSYSDVDECAKCIAAVQNSSLEELDLTGLENMPVMLDGRLHFDALKILSLEGWLQMGKLPPQVCDLPSLNKLILRGCRGLKLVSESIVYLRELTHLDLSDCIYLEELTSRLGELTALRYLDLTSSKALIKLPDNFGQLSALECLSLRGCFSLKELPGNFAQLKSLKSLDLTDCKGLKELPLNFEQLSALECLSLTMCIYLQELPGNFARLSSLKSLDLSECWALFKLPSDFGQLRSLNSLNLTDCKGLKVLPASFGQLSALECLCLRRCSHLRKLPREFPQLKSLKTLDLSNCDRLELPSNFTQLRSLERLDLTGCLTLQETGLPADFSKQLPCLEVLGP